MDELITQASHESVTKEKLTGEKRYFPDASEIFKEPFNIEGEIPEYIVLLTKNSFFNTGMPTTQARNTAVVDGTGSLVLTNRALYMITESSVRQFRYDQISLSGWTSIEKTGKIIITRDGVEFSFETAKSGDDETAREALGYLREQVDES